MATRVGREVHGEEEEKGGRAVASYEKILSFMRCSRRVYLCAYSELDDSKALGSYERYDAYGVNYSPISRRKTFRRLFTRFAARFLA